MSTHLGLEPDFFFFGGGAPGAPGHFGMRLQLAAAEGVVLRVRGHHHLNGETSREAETRGRWCAEIFFSAKHMDLFSAKMIGFLFPWKLEGEFKTYFIGMNYFAVVFF